MPATQKPKTFTRRKPTREVLVKSADTEVIAVLDFAFDRCFCLGQKLQESRPVGRGRLHYRGGMQMEMAFMSL